MAEKKHKAQPQEEDRGCVGDIRKRVENKRNFSRNKTGRGCGKEEGKVRY